MRNIVITQSNKRFAVICGRSGIKGLISSFGVDNIKISSPDDHYPKIDFVSPFKPRYDRCSAYADIDEKLNHPDNVFIS